MHVVTGVARKNIGGGKNVPLFSLLYHIVSDVNKFCYYVICIYVAVSVRCLCIEDLM